MLLCLSALEIFAQQDAQIGQYMQNKSIVNPAAAGSEGGNLSIFYRTQWINLPGSPKTIGAVGDIGLQNGIGLGINLINTGQGALSFTRALANFSYKINLTPDVSALYLGLQAGAVQYSIDTKDLILHDDITLDQTFYSSTLKKIIPDFGFGAMLKLKNVYFGASLPHLLQPKIKFINTIDTASRGRSGERNSFAKIFRHYYFTAGGDIAVSPTVNLQPALLLKFIANAPLTADVNMNVLVLDRYWGGVGYRIAKPGALIFMAGLKIKTLKFGYVYELSQSQLSAYGGATHELMVNYQFSGQPEAKPSKKPYFLK